MGADVASQVGQLADVDRPVVHPGDQRPLERHATTGDLEPAPAGGHERLEGVATVDGDELVAQLVVGGMQRDGEVDRQPGGRQAPDARHQPDGRHGEVAGREPEVVVEPVERGDDAVEVRHRLAHPHEDDVREAPGAGLLHRSHDLLDDLAGGELALEARLAGRAEAAAHGAPGLRGDADRGAVGVVHEDGLHEGAVVELPQPLDGVLAVRRRHRGRLQREGEGVVDLLAQGDRQVGHLRRLDGPPVEPVPHLACPVGRLAGEGDGEVLRSDVVAGGHPSNATGGRCGWRGAQARVSHGDGRDCR